MMTTTDKKEEEAMYSLGYNTRTGKNTVRKRSVIKRMKGYWNWRIEKPLYHIYGINYSFLNRYFAIGGMKLRYFINRYNAVRSERVVEIPFALNQLGEESQSGILEVGNVLSHYRNVSYDIVDKYEVGKGIINIDILDYNPGRKYRKIISISTVEHIGFDEPVREKGKAEKAITKIYDLLEANGTAIITVPLAYNPEIDDIIKNKKIEFHKAYFMKRVGLFNLWKETTLDGALTRKHGSRYMHTNAIALLVLKKP